MKKIKLTRGVFTKVDDEDYEDLSQWKWSAIGKEGYLYAKRAKRKYIIHEGEKYYNQKFISMHRQIMGVDNPKIIVDHKDGDSLNNCRDNLRICTAQQNIMNRKSSGGKASKYKGVRQRGKNGQWTAIITVNRKAISLGVYKTELEAVAAYNIGAKKHHGEFARINEVDFKLPRPQKTRFLRPPNASSKYMGVAKLKQTGHWQASIIVNSKLIYLGTYINETDAAHAYNFEALKQFGDKAVLNNISVEHQEDRIVRNNSSKYQGVSWCMTHKKWVSRLTINGKRTFFGYFNQEIEAMNAIKSTQENQTV